MLTTPDAKSLLALSGFLNIRILYELKSAHIMGSTVRTEIVENGAGMPGVSDFGLGEKTRREDPPSALT